MPRKNNLLPFLSIEKDGRAVYTRRLKPEMAQRVGQKIFKRRIGKKTTAAALRAAWLEVHQEFEERIREAQARGQRQAGESACDLAQGGRRNHDSLLSDRILHGIAAGFWLRMLDIEENAADVKTDPLLEVALRVSQWASLNEGFISFNAYPEYREALANYLHAAGYEPSRPNVCNLRAAISEIQPAYKTEHQARSSGDYSPGPLSRRVPPEQTQSSLSWSDLLETWLKSKGGLMEEEGYGVRRSSMKRMKVAMRECAEVLEGTPPDQVTIPLARKYREHLQKMSMAYATKAGRIATLSSAYKTAVPLGLVDVNPFSSMGFTKPRGLETNRFAFTDQQMLAIVQRAVAWKPQQRSGKDQRLWTLYLLISQGSRLGEVLQLQIDDVVQSEGGHWSIHYQHDLGQLKEGSKERGTRSLKGDKGGERIIPIHPKLLELGLLDYVNNQRKLCRAGLMEGISTDNCSFGQWFRERVLISTGIYKKNRLTTHSIRHWCLDSWRKQGIRPEITRAFTAHAARDVADKVYGEGLGMMPDVLMESVEKLDLSWLEPWKT